MALKWNAPHWLPVSYITFTQITLHQMHNYVICGLKIEALAGAICDMIIKEVMRQWLITGNDGKINVDKEGTLVLFDCFSKYGVGHGVDGPAVPGQMFSIILCHHKVDATWEHYFSQKMSHKNVLHSPSWETYTRHGHLLKNYRSMANLSYPKT